MTHSLKCQFVYQRVVGALVYVAAVLLELDGHQHAELHGLLFLAQGSHYSWVTLGTAGLAHRAATTTGMAEIAER